MKRDHGGTAGPIDRAYVSEFTRFMDRFLEEHPEVIRDQKIGRSIYWDRKVDLAELDRAAEDVVPDDTYGFSYAAWRRADQTQVAGSDRPNKGDREEPPASTKTPRS